MLLDRNDREGNPLYPLCRGVQGQNTIIFLFPGSPAQWAGLYNTFLIPHPVMKQEGRDD
jgi:hypothetical protein